MQPWRWNPISWLQRNSKDMPIDGGIEVSLPLLLHLQNPKYKMTKMIESLAAKVSKLKVEQSSGKARFQNTFAPRNPNPFRRTNEQLQIIQRGKEVNEEKKLRLLSRM